MALGVLAEALARIEHKLDLLLRGTLSSSRLISVGDKSHACPLCNQQVKYSIDILKRVLTRQCGCKTGFQPPVDLEAYAPPPAARRQDDAEREAGHVDADPSADHRGGAKRR